MATNSLNVKSLVEQMPEVDKPGAPAKFTGPPWPDAEKVYEAILRAGRTALETLLDLVKDPADPAFDNYKPEYVLHGLVVYLGRAGKEKEGRLLAQMLAEKLKDERITKATRGLFIRELQWLGSTSEVPLLARHLHDEQLGPYAVAALEAIGKPAAKELVRGLAGATGRNRLAIIQALGRLEATDALGNLRRLLADSDPDTRMAAAWALANMGDATSASALLRIADTAGDWEKAQITKACLVLAEKVAARQPAEARKIYLHLQRTRTGAKERYVRDAAEKGLAALNVMS